MRQIIVFKSAYFFRKLTAPCLFGYFLCLFTTLLREPRVLCVQDVEIHSGLLHFRLLLEGTYLRAKGELMSTRTVLKNN
jgi:hypothetical protein